MRSSAMKRPLSMPCGVFTVSSVTTWNAEVALRPANAPRRNIEESIDSKPRLTVLRSVVLCGSNA
jgi:hypothetical protein